MLRLKLQYFGHLMQRVDSLEKTLILGGIGGRRKGDDRGWDGWMASLTRWTWVWVDSRSWWWTGRPGVLWFMRSQRVRHDWVTELNWASVVSLWYPMGCGPPGPSVHEIFQARILERVAISLSKESSLPRDWTQVSHIAGRLFNVRATRKPCLTLDDCYS